MSTTHPGLEQLVGRQMSSVEFVRGYVQLRFDGPCLSAYTMPTIEMASGGRLDVTSPGYADALVSAIGKTVDGAQDRNGQAIELRFADGPVLNVSLLDSDRRVEEAATLTTNGNAIWTW